LLKRWLRASRATRIAVGLIYLVVAFTMPLCYTRSLGGAHGQTCNCSDGCHYSCCKISSCEQLSVSSKHTERKAGSRSNHGPYMACLYSITSDLQRSAQFEHTVLVTQKAVEILTLPEQQSQPFVGKNSKNRA
jgi:hypothetical protein